MPPIFSTLSRAQLFHCLLASATILVTAVVLHYAWVAEDAFITFRTVEQFFAGNGLRWNPHDRVQAFTHPLWLFVLIVGRTFYADLFLVAIWCGTLCSVAAFVTLGLRFHANAGRLAVFLALLVGSRAWRDFSTSGLENSLSSLLAAFTVVHFLRRSGTHTSQSVLLISLLFSFTLLNRIDAGLLILPLVGVAFMNRARSVKLFPTGMLAIVGLSPFLGWTLFSLLYYGFPFPNTAYAKLGTGIDRLQLMAKGLVYLMNSLRLDPLTLPTIGAAIILGLKDQRPIFRWLAVGLLLQVFYLVMIGGDFMSGRFLSLPLFAAAFLVAQLISPLKLLLLGLVILVTALGGELSSKLSLWLSPGGERGIGDERKDFWRASSLRACRLLWKVDEPCPQHRWITAGLAFRDSPRRVRIMGNIGMFGYYAGTDKIVLDHLALADPLLARLAASPQSFIQPGHIRRKLPQGYFESVVTGSNMIVNENLRRYFEKLKIVTQGELWSWERLRAILELNGGVYDQELQRYEADRLLKNEHQ